MTSAQPNAPTLKQLVARELPRLLFAYLTACAIMVFTVMYTDFNESGQRVITASGLIPFCITIIAVFRFCECLAIANKTLTWRLRFALIAVIALGSMLPHYTGIAICVSYATASPCARSDTVALGWMIIIVGTIAIFALRGAPPLRMKVVYRELTDGTSRLAKKCNRLYGIDVATLPWIVDKLD